MVRRKDLLEPFAIRELRESVRDSLASHGEECIVLHMYHVATDEPDAPRCPACWDDVYADTSDPDCTRCYGTTFDGGVKQVARVWALFTDDDNTETFRREGVWTDSNRTMQTEGLPQLTQHDYVIRVTKWEHSVARGIENVYVTSTVDPTSLRTGEGSGHNDKDVVGQRTVLDALPADHVMRKYPVIGVKFDRLDGRVR